MRLEVPKIWFDNTWQVHVPESSVSTPTHEVVPA